MKLVPTEWLYRSWAPLPSTLLPSRCFRKGKKVKSGGGRDETREDGRAQDRGLRRTGSEAASLTAPIFLARQRVRAAPAPGDGVGRVGNRDRTFAMRRMAEKGNDALLANPYELLNNLINYYLKIRYFLK